MGSPFTFTKYYDDGSSVLQYSESIASAFEALHPLATTGQTARAMAWAVVELESRIAEIFPNQTDAQDVEVSKMRRTLPAAHAEVETGRRERRPPTHPWSIDADHAAVRPTVRNTTTS